MALLVEGPVAGLGPVACGVLLDLGLRAEIFGEEGAQVVGVVGTRNP
jgi:hypothetical protein